MFTRVVYLFGMARRTRRINRLPQLDFIKVNVRQKLSLVVNRATPALALRRTNATRAAAVAAATTAPLTVLVAVVTRARMLLVRRCTLNE